jgi:hypothetical protein
MGTIRLDITDSIMQAVTAPSSSNLISVTIKCFSFRVGLTAVHLLFINFLGFIGLVDIVLVGLVGIVFIGLLDIVFIGLVGIVFIGLVDIVFIGLVDIVVLVFAFFLAHLFPFLGASCSLVCINSGNKMPDCLNKLAWPFREYRM